LIAAKIADTFARVEEAFWIEEGIGHGAWGMGHGVKGKVKKELITVNE